MTRKEGRFAHLEMNFIEKSTDIPSYSPVLSQCRSSNAYEAENVPMQITVSLKSTI